MLTSASVCSDGNELVAFQTGLWGAFAGIGASAVGRIRQQLGAFFYYYAPWCAGVCRLGSGTVEFRLIAGRVPLEVFRQGNCITGVRFADFTVKAKITLDATELGDLLALAEIPYRWGWELQSEWGEHSAPTTLNTHRTIPSPSAHLGCDHARFR